MVAQTQKLIIMKAFIKDIKNGIMTVIVGQLIESDEILYTDYQYIRGRGNKDVPIRGKMIGEAQSIVLPPKWDGKTADDQILRWSGKDHRLFNAASAEEVVETIAKENPFAFTSYQSLSDRAFEGLCKSVGL